MPEEPKKSLIGDLAGISEPLKKLIEVVSSGVGRFTDAMWFAKRDADNEAYKILKTGGAQTQVVVDRIKAVGAIGNGSTPQIQKLTLSGNEVNAELSDGQQAILALKERSDNRAEYQNLLHQFNTEQTVSFAAEELAQEGTEVSKEPVDDNWKSRYFNIVQDISGEEMQALWGKVLAGKVKNPSSFSLRTLEVLRNISQKEAELFTVACKYLAITRASGNLKSYNIFKGDGYSFKGLDSVFSFDEISLLIECGLFHPDKNIVTSKANPSNLVKAGFVIGTKLLWFEGEDINGISDLHIAVYSLTNAGQEISTLIKPECPPMEYLQGLSKIYKARGISAKWNDFIGWTSDNGVETEGELVDLPADTE